MRTVRIEEYELETETDEEQRAGQRYHPANVIVWNGHRYTLGAGSSDEVDVFEESGALFVLARNRLLGYAGLQVFRDGELLADPFIDSDEMGGYLNELTAIYAAKRMANWCDFNQGGY